MPDRLFEDSWKRIDRAITHAKAFADEWAGLMNPHTYKVDIKRKDKRTFVAFASIEVAPENDLALQLGEFFYQLRAALDGIVYKATVSQSFPKLPANESRIEFPIYPSSKKFYGSAVHSGPLPDELKAWLELIQPYNITNIADSKQAELARRLSLLHDCARKDRHRRLHVVAAVPTTIDWKFKITGCGSVTRTSRLRANLLENEGDFLEFEMVNFSGTDTKVELETDLTVEISVGEIPGFVGQGLMEELKRMMLAVRHIVDVFERGFK